MPAMNRCSAKAETGSPPTRIRAWSAGLATTLLALGLAACGGGGGGSDGNSPAPLGLVKVTVRDAFGTSVAGATVLGPQGQVVTDLRGEALVVLPSPDATAGITVSNTAFVEQIVSATSATGRVAEVDVTLARATSAAGGSLSTRSGRLPSANSSGEQLTFEIELVVVDGDSKPIENLSQANFVLRACSPSSASASVNCVRGTGTSVDVAYAPVTPAPEALERVAGLDVQPYAAALLLDQSGSIQQSDASGARLFSSKVFLDGLGVDDQALVAAFAGGTGATLPTRPLTLYGAFRTRNAVSSYFPVLDSLSKLVGGNTPLYASIDALGQHLKTDASVPTGLGKAMVIFTDGADTDCRSVEACRASRMRTIQQANQNQVRLFTIGLSDGVDVAALGELANQTGGALLYADTPEQLLPLYGSVGRLLSLSLPTYRLRWTVQAAAAGAFRPGQSLIGRVQVSAAGKVFDVPFIVGIP